METITENYQGVSAMDSTLDGQETNQSEELHETDKGEPVGEETTDKSVIDREKNCPHEEPMDTDESSGRIDEHESIIMMEERLLEEKRAAEFGEKMSDSCQAENQEAGVSESAEVKNPRDDDRDGDGDVDGVESKDDDTDKGSEGKSQTNDQDNQESTSQLDDPSTSLDLTKGGRSNKCDYETTPTATRSSSRTKSPELQWGTDDLDNLPTFNCRKCRVRTPHSVDDGCQVCIYNKVVEQHNRREIQKSQRTKSKPVLVEKCDYSKMDKSRKAATSSSSSSKRKSASKQSKSKTNQSQTKSGGNITTNNSISTSKNSDKSNSNLGSASQAKINENNNDMSKPQEVTGDTKSGALDSADSGEPVSPQILSTEDAAAAAAASTFNSIDRTSDDRSEAKSPVVDIRLPKLYSWTPDEVADYISSKGFSQEAELFKAQSVDGISLLLMQRTDFTYGLKIKLGPALKIYDQVSRLKREYFKVVSVAN